MLNALVIPIELIGKKLAAPDVTISFVSSYYCYLDNDIDLALQVSYNWQTETFGDDFMNGDDIYAQPSYGLLGANFTATAESWVISAYIDNITDEKYYDSGLNDTGINYQRLQIMVAVHSAVLLALNIQVIPMCNKLVVG